MSGRIDEQQCAFAEALTCRSAGARVSENVGEGVGLLDMLVGEGVELLGARVGVAATHTPAHLADVSRHAPTECADSTPEVRQQYA